MIRQTHERGYSSAPSLEGIDWRAPQHTRSPVDSAMTSVGAVQCVAPTTLPQNYLHRDDCNGREAVHVEPHDARSSATTERHSIAEGDAACGEQARKRSGDARQRS